MLSTQEKAEQNTIMPKPEHSFKTLRDTACKTCPSFLPPALGGAALLRHHKPCLPFCTSGNLGFSICTGPQLEDTQYTLSNTFIFLLIKKQKGKNC